MGRILAIDYGEKRLGIALSDETKKISLAQPYISRMQLEKLLDLIKKEEVEQIILGLPKSLSGKENASTKTVRKFGAWLGVKTGLPIRFIEEWFSTKEAQRKITEQKLKGRAARNRIDSLAAQVFLDIYLNQFRS